MLYDKDKQLAKPDGIGYCPDCGEQLRPKCGDIKIWHWSHIHNHDCDPKPETKWHLLWKKVFPKQFVEVKIGDHRADVWYPHYAVEFQNSTISKQEIESREQTYGNVIWVINARRLPISYTTRPDHVKFRWKWPRKAWKFANGTLLFDDQCGLTVVRKIHWGEYVAGWGYRIDHRWFIDAIKTNTFDHKTTKVITQGHDYDDEMVGIMPNTKPVSAAEYDEWLAYYGWVPSEWKRIDDGKPRPTPQAIAAARETYREIWGWVPPPETSPATI